MSRLLHAGAYRLKKSKVHWISLAVIVGYGAFIYILQYYNMQKYHFEMELESSFFQPLMLMGIVTAVFVSLSVGTEYSDGTIRNKLVIGMSRTEIYLSNFVLQIVSAVGIVLCTYLVGCVLGIPLLGTPNISVGMMTQICVVGILLCIAYVSIFNMITMNVASKANAAVICILLAIGMMLVSSYLLNCLNQPKYIDQAVMKNGQVVIETVKNQYYLTGMKRQIYQNVSEIFPSGQGMYVAGMQIINPVRMMIYSVIVTVVTTACGMGLFQKKDIK